MENTYPQEHNGRSYWITLKNASVNDRSGYHAFVSDDEPTEGNFGMPVKDENREIMFFTNKHSALLNANAVKQSEMD